VSASDAYRIVYTEGTHIAAETTAFSMQQYFEWYDVSTYNDNRVCEICRELQDNGPFRLSERAEGINFPPLHPFCRCRVEPHVDDWDEWRKGYEARATGTKEIEGMFE
jgi:SPP1 gp7 family putative phage head morphogenesis protein